MIDGTAAVDWEAMLANVLDAPVAKLTMGDDIDARQNFVDTGTLLNDRLAGSHKLHAGPSTHLVLLKTILEDILDHQATRLAQSDFVPHAAESLVHVSHDLRRRVVPAELEQLLPNVTGVAMNDRLRDPTEQFVNHDSLVFFGNGVKGLLDDVTSKSVHAEVQGVATNSIGDGHDLLWGTMFEAALHEKVPEAIDHEWVGLCNDGLHDFVLLLGCADLQLLLKEDRCLLVIVAHDLVDDVFPIAIHRAIQQATVVQRLDRRHVGLTG